MQLLKKALIAKRERMEKLRLESLDATREALCALLPGGRAVLFGSLMRPGKFHENSDVDIALFATPAGGSEYRLQALMEETLGRRVDIVLLPHCRFREKILREGLLWTK